MELTAQATRRKFLFNAGKSVAALAVANAGIYAVGSAFKNLDGSMVAGAKNCECLCWREAPLCGFSGFNTLSESCIVVAPSCDDLNTSGCDGIQRVMSCLAL